MTSRLQPPPPGSTARLATAPRRANWPEATPPRPRLLLISPVPPWPLRRGQQVRVYQKLRALREHFHTTLLTLAPPKANGALPATLADDVRVLPRLSRRSTTDRLRHGVGAHVSALRSGLRASNYLMNTVELSPARLATAVNPADFDLALFEYWHANDSIRLFRRHGVPCVLDMHDILWRVVERRLQRWPLPAAIRRRRVRRYRDAEESAWARYDALIAINRGEQAYVASRWPALPVLYAPMGLDLAHWPYRWAPANPPRLAFYGALGNVGNQIAVRHCLAHIMPRIWAERPDVTFWIIGGDPPPEVARLAADPRIHVTGFVDDVAAVLATTTAVLCPWRGRFGFRSRLIEVMATGAPVIATPDAVYGMDLAPGQGLFLAEDDAALAGHALALLQSETALRRASARAREQVEARFSFAATYGTLAAQLAQFVPDA